MFRNSRSFVAFLVGSGLALCLSAPPAFGQATPWLAEPGTGTVNISYTNQNATDPTPTRTPPSSSARLPR